MDTTEEKLAIITAPSAWTYPPLANLILLEALPPAARERETKKAADTFASTGRNIFVHYATPILEERRKRLLASGLRKKKYPKTAAQIWQDIGHEDEFFWNQAARELRQSIKDGSLSPKRCLIQGGRLAEKETYVWHAEVAVARYLELPAVVEKTDEDKVVSAGVSAQKSDELVTKLEYVGISDAVSIENQNKDAAADKSSDTQNIELLDTLPDRFSYEPKMMYSHFAHYDYATIRAAEGKHQTAMLRQLADLFDKTGKILFYYYAVPRLRKRMYPPTDGATVTGEAVKVWQFMVGTEKEKWQAASADVKKMLGDGNLDGLEALELGSLDPEVLKLHEMASAALESREERKKAG